MEPTPVTLSSPNPVPVEVVKAPIQKVQGVQSQLHDPSIAATTTFQEDLTTAGQRQINLIWERTQATIAIVVVIVAMVASVYGMVYDTDIPNLVSVAFGMVTGFYFSRTNHAAIGGAGPKPLMQKYEGR